MTSLQLIESTDRHQVVAGEDRRGHLFEECKPVYPLANEFVEDGPSILGIGENAVEVDGDALDFRLVQKALHAVGVVDQVAGDVDAAEPLVAEVDKMAGCKPAPFVIGGVDSRQVALAVDGAGQGDGNVGDIVVGQFLKVSDVAHLYGNQEQRVHFEAI